MEVLTTLQVRGKTFYVVKNGNYFCAIDTEYLDEDGRLKQTLNGLQMHANKSMPQCIEETRASVEIEYRIGEGMSFEDAFRDVYNLTKAMTPRKRRGRKKKIEQ